MERASTWTLRVGLLALLIVAPWPFGSVTPAPASLLSASLLVLAGLYVGTQIYRRRLHPLPGWHWLAPSLALVVFQQVPLPRAWVGVAAPAVAGFYAPVAAIDVDVTHTLSAEPFQTRWVFLQLMSYVAAFYVASQLFRRGRVRRMLVYTVAGLGVALALFGVYQQARFGTVLYGRFQVPSGTPYGPFVNHNHFAGFVEACALLTLGLGIGTARRNASLALLLGGAAGLMGISLLLSHSRGGLIATGAGLVMLVALTRREERHRRHWILGGVGAMALFLAAFAPSSLSERLSTLGDPGSDRSIQFRLDLWSDSTSIVADTPLVGTGLGTYASVIPSYRTGVDETRAEFAESDWMQLACETGVVGVLLAAGFLFSIARLGIRCISVEPSHRSRGLVVGALAASGALLVHGLYDFNLHIPSNALLFAILLGLLASSSGGIEPLVWESRRVFSVAVPPLAAVIIALAIVVLDIGESRRLTRTIDPVLTSADEFTDSIQALVRSRRAVPQNPETAFLLGRLYNEEAYRSPDAARYREARLDQAAGAFREALSLAPARGRYWFELGWTEANRGNDAFADALFTRSLELEPQHSNIRANYASYLASRGRIDEALAQLERGRELEPGIKPLDALNIIGPFLGGDTALMRRAVGSGADAQAALEHFRTGIEE